MRNRIRERFEFSVTLVAFLHPKLKFFGVTLHFVEQQFAVRHVARDFREAIQLTAFIAQRGHHNTRPKSGAIFAYAPALSGKVTGLFGCSQNILRQSRAAVLFGVEAREMLPYDLVRRKAFNSLRAAVP